MALNPKTFGDLITFSRTSEGTRRNAAGKVEVVSANQPRFQFGPNGEALGILVEEARTNFIPHSDLRTGTPYDIFDPSVVDQGVILSSTGPDGTAGVRRFRVTGAHSVSIMRFGDAAAGTPGNPYAGTIYARTPDGVARTLVIDVNDVPAPSIELNSNWRRVSVVGADSANPYRFLDLTFGSDGDYELFGVQIEEGGSATSYMPTGGVAATRGWDVATIPVSSIPSFNPGAGTIVVEATVPPLVALRWPGLWVMSKDLNNRLGAFIDPSGYTYFVIVANGNAVQAFSPVALASETKVKAAFTFDSAAAGLCVNGGVTAYVPGGSIIVPTALENLQLGVFDNALNAPIKSIVYYPTRLSDAELQQVTTL